jgi:hypothetical protein
MTRTETLNGYRVPSVTPTPPYPFNSPPTYQRLLGSYFIRYYYADSLHIQLQVFDLECRLQYSRRVSFPVWPFDPLVVQRPSDSMIVLIWGGRDGIHGTFLSNRLDLMIADTTISSIRQRAIRPSGAFRNDTLFVVWEDYRNGTADIYGNWHYVPGTTASVEDTAGQPGDVHGRDSSRQAAGPPALTILSVIPNPAFTSSTISFSLPQPVGVALDLFDAMGRLAWHRDAEARPAGTNACNVDAAGLPDGIYTVVVSAGNGSATARLVLFHP